MKISLLIKLFFVFIAGAIVGGIGVNYFWEKKSESITNDERQEEEKFDITANESKGVVASSKKERTIKHLEVLESNDSISENSIALNTDTLVPLESVTPDTIIDAAEDNKNLETDENLTVLSDQFLAKNRVAIERIVLDTTSIEALLNVQTNYFGDYITVEYWESPLELTGYELSRNKLTLYGFNPLDPIQITTNETTAVLDVSIGAIQLRLERTERFRTLYP